MPERQTMLTTHRRFGMTSGSAEILANTHPKSYDSAMWRIYQIILPLLVSSCSGDPLSGPGAPNDAQNVDLAQPIPDFVVQGLSHFSFTAGLRFSAGGTPYQPVVADFNGDGKLDFSVAYAASMGPGFVMVCLGNGDGTFQDPILSHTPAPSDTIAAGDFDGDGHLDLVLVQPGAQGNRDELGVVLGRGDGTFGQLTSFPGVLHMGLMAGADFDHDNRPDVAVTAQAGIAVFLGNGKGGVGAASILALPFAAGQLAIADLDGNGNLDLVASESGGSDIHTFLGDGKGGFVPGGLAQSMLANTGPTIGDIDNDGAKDINIADGPKNGIEVFRG